MELLSENSASRRGHYSDIHRPGGCPHPLCGPRHARGPAINEPGTAVGKPSHLFGPATHRVVMLPRPVHPCVPQVAVRELVVLLETRGMIKGADGKYLMYSDRIKKKTKHSKKKKKASKAKAKAASFAALIGLAGVSVDPSSHPHVAVGR